MSLLLTILQELKHCTVCSVFASLDYRYISIEPVAQFILSLFLRSEVGISLHVMSINICGGHQQPGYKCSCPSTFALALDQ